MVLFWPFIKKPSGHGPQVRLGLSAAERENMSYRKSLVAGGNKFFALGRDKASAPRPQTKVPSFDLVDGQIFPDAPKPILRRIRFCSLICKVILVKHHYQWSMVVHTVVRWSWPYCLVDKVTYIYSTNHPLGPWKTNATKVDAKNEGADVQEPRHQELHESELETRGT